MNGKSPADDFEKDEDYANEDYAVPTISYAENLDQGHGMHLGDRVRLFEQDMVQLKEIIDENISPYLVSKREVKYNVDVRQIQNLQLQSDNLKLQNIPVSVEDTDHCGILVKVGPCDLSGVGGHQVRQEIIRNLVNQALKKKGLDKEHDFESVNVSACVGVRGRAQMAKGFFIGNRGEKGSHMNAYVKTSKEKGLTHWEPRKGPQRWYNDTICAMVTSTTTSMFEQGIRDGTIKSSKQATLDILKNKKLVDIFDDLLKRTKDRIKELIKGIKAMALSSREGPER